MLELDDEELEELLELLELLVEPEVLDELDELEVEPPSNTTSIQPWKRS